LNAGLLPKRLELLSELVPTARLIAVLVNPNNWTAAQMIGEPEGAADAKGVQLRVLRAGTESEIHAAFEALVSSPTVALVVGTDAFFLAQRDLVVALAKRHSVPAIYEWREFVATGGLISYGASVTAPYRLAGTYVGRILRGAKPAELPVQQPMTFELAVNLATAKALGLTVPPSILARADEVIE